MVKHTEGKRIASFLAPDCPSRGHRLNGDPSGRRMRSAPPTIDPATTHKGQAAMRKMAAEKDQAQRQVAEADSHDQNTHQAADHRRATAAGAKPPMESATCPVSQRLLTQTPHVRSAWPAQLSLDLVAGPG
jgi:hypothetical protein